MAFVSLPLPNSIKIYSPFGEGVFYFGPFAFEQGFFLNFDSQPTCLLDQAWANSLRRGGLTLHKEYTSVGDAGDEEDELPSYLGHASRASGSGLSEALVWCLVAPYAQNFYSRARLSVPQHASVIALRRVPRTSQ